MDPVSRAQSDSSQQTGRKRGYGRPFQPGVSGNPGGRKKKLITEIMDRALRKKANRDEIQEVIMDVIRSRRMASVLMLREVAERTEGKVADIVDMNVTGNITLEQVLEAKKKAKKD